MSLLWSEADDEYSDYLYDMRRDERAERKTRTDNPEQIRNAMHEPEQEARPSIYPYVLVRGELVKVESDDE